MEKEMGKEKNIMILGQYYLKDNILMEKEMGKEKNIIIRVIYYLKGNI